MRNVSGIPGGTPHDGPLVGTYDRQFPDDPRNAASPWSLLALQVPVGASVLDLGCWDGELLARLRDRGAGRVRGIERDLKASSKARARGLDIVCADLDDPDWPGSLQGERFDRVILADVLEHVRDPIGSLGRIVEHVLTADGFVVLSVPNVAHASVRLSLLVGDFDRTDRGILDRTHLHFFTRRSLHALLSDAGLVIVEAVDAVQDVPLAVLEATLARAGVTSTPDLQRALVEAADARAYQFVWSAQRRTPGTPPAPPPAPTSGDTPRIVDRLIRSQAAKIRRLEERLRVLQSKGRFRSIRYAWLRFRQRRDRTRTRRG